MSWSINGSISELVIREQKFKIEDMLRYLIEYQYLIPLHPLLCAKITRKFKLQPCKEFNGKVRNLLRR